MEPSLTHETFAKHINTKFQVQLDDTDRVELELAEVSELKLHPQQEEFAIVFRGPLEVFLGQGIRSVEHERMGQFEIFIVPVREDAQGFYYEAVFNRVRSPELAGPR